MKKLKSLLATIAIFATTTFSAIALPGVEQKIPDQSGQFVYYKDSSFERESYIGLVYFDDATYGIRYYAPATNNKPELGMELYLTIDTEKAATKGVIEFTGETPPNPFPHSQDETDIVNYLHDIFYEIFPKRLYLGGIDKKISENYELSQFGGRVSMDFDPMIPILNLKRIMTSDGKIVFNAVTGGKLISSDDTSFSDFKGIPSKINSAKSKKIKSGKSNKIEIENGELKSQSFEIDENWEQKSAASWMLNEISAVSTVSLPIPENQKDILIRTLILGRDHSYPDWTKQILKEEKESISLNQIFYDSSSKSFKNDFKKIENLDSNTKAIFDLTVSSDAYTTNKSYFDKILKSYKVK